MSFFTAVFAGVLQNQTSVVVSVSQNELLIVSQTDSSSLILDNVSWSQRNYFCNASVTESRTILDVNGQVDTSLDSSEKPSVFLETTGLNISNSLSSFHLRFKQDSSVAVIVRFGVNSEDWLKATAENETLAMLRYGGTVNGVVWVMWPYSSFDKGGILEGIWGTGNWQTLSVNWRDYLCKALHYNFTSLKGLQLILGFGDVETFNSTIDDIAFSFPSQLTPYRDFLNGSIFVFRSFPIEKFLNQSFFPERSRVQFQMSSDSQGRFMALMVWKNASGDLLVVRNGFELESVVGPQSLWIDFWNVIFDVKSSIMPFSTLSDVMNPNDFALVFLSTSSGANGIFDVDVEKIDLFLSKPGLAAAINNQFDIDGVINETTFFLFLVGVVPLLLLVCFYFFRRFAVSKKFFWFGLIVASGLMVRFILAPISSHQADVLQFSDIGGLFFGQGSLFSFWVDFPLYYYPLVSASLPYSLARANGFMDSTFYAMTSYVWQMVAIKFVPIFADLLAYVYLNKLFGTRRDRLLSMGPEIYFLCPLVILTSATWAHLNSLFIALLIVGFYYARQGHWIKSVFLFSLASMTIPVGFAGVLAIVLISILLKKYKLTVKMLLVSAVTFFALILPMVFGAEVSIGSILQRLTVGQVANAPVYAPSPLVIGGVTVYPFMTSGYKFTRILEYNNIGVPPVFLQILLVGSILIGTLWFMLRVKSNMRSKDDLNERLFENITRYLAVVFCFFILFYSTTNFIWNFWPLFSLILLLLFVKRNWVAALVIVYSYILLIGFEFVEHFSFLATGYNIQYFDQLGLKLDYWTMNLVFSLSFSLLTILVIVVAIFVKKGNTNSSVKRFKNFFHSLGGNSN